MKKYFHILFFGLIILSIVGLSPRFHQHVHAAEPDGELRALYEDDGRFDQLSGAAQSMLEQKFGPKEPTTSIQPQIDTLEQKAPLVGPVPPLASASYLMLNDVLVNDPTLDPLPSADNFTQSETSLVLGLTSNTVIVGYNDSGSFTSMPVDQFTGFSRSGDMGATFTDKGALPFDPVSGDAGDPVLARDSVSGTIYFSTLQFSGSGIQVFRSFDDGVSFPLPTVQGAPGKTGFQDKEWITVDNFGGPGQGNVYLVVRDFGPGDGIYFFSSTDGLGATFGPAGGTLIASGAAGNVQGAFVVVDPSQDVYVFYFDQRALPQTIKMRKSTDFGATFGPEVIVATLSTTAVNGNLGLPWRSNAFPQVVVNPVNGNIYATYNDNPAGVDLGDIFLTQSTDGGLTWSAPIRVNQDATTNAQWQPALGVTPDGNRLFFGWYDFDSGTNQINVFGRIAGISGAVVSFGESFPINTVSFPPNFGNDAVVNATYMGDYDQAVADNSFFYYTWADNRLGTPDVRFVKIPAAVLLALDIKPGSFPNSINPRSKGVIPVAILSSTTFDATTIVPSTVEFGPNGAKESHGKGHIEDVNGDLMDDLVLHFKTQETGIQCGDMVAAITGQTSGGVPIQADDSIRTVGCN
jgi:hypothetical protein